MSQQLAECLYQGVNRCLPFGGEYNSPDSRKPKPSLRVHIPFPIQLKKGLPTPLAALGYTVGSGDIVGHLTFSMWLDSQ